jgi:hypothetical protein
MKTARPSRAAWTHRVPIEDIPETGRHFHLVADEATRASLAEAAGLRALPCLEATFEVSRHGRNGLHVAGEVSATVGQTCVVTLDPVDSEVRETIELLFLPPRAEDAVADATVDLDAEEPPERLDDGAVDLGAVAAEFLMLGIDPYPRKPGAVFRAPQTGEAPNRPFAALAALKKGAGKPEW